MKSVLTLLTARLLMPPAADTMMVLQRAVLMLFAVAAPVHGPPRFCLRGGIPPPLPQPSSNASAETCSASRRESLG